MLTGLAGIDHFMGGLPAGIVDIYGDAGVGKTALAAQLLAQAGRDDRPALLVCSQLPDVERMRALGVPDDLPVYLPDSWAQMCFVLVRILRNTKGCLVVVDSSAGLETTLETGERLGTVDQRARRVEIEEVLLALSWAALSGGSTVVLLSELRDVQRTRRTGSSLRQFDRRRFTARIELQQLKYVAAYGRMHHKVIQWRTLHSRVGQPGATYRLHLFDETGFDRHFEMLRCWTATGQVTRRGGMLELETGVRLGPGYERATQQLRAMVP